MSNTSQNSQGVSSNAASVSHTMSQTTGKSQTVSGNGMTTTEKTFESHIEGASGAKDIRGKSHSESHSTGHGQQTNTVSMTLEREANGSEVGVFSKRQAEVGAGLVDSKEIVVTHAMHKGESYNEDEFRRAASGEQIAGYKVDHLSASSNINVVSAGPAVELPRGAGLSEGASPSHSHSSAHSSGSSSGMGGSSSAQNGLSASSARESSISSGHRASSSSSSGMSGSFSAHDGAHRDGIASASAHEASGSHSVSSGQHSGVSTGYSAVQGAIQQHLETHGSSIASSHSHDISSALSSHMQGKSASSHDSLNFHKDGDVAVSIGSSISHSEGTSVSMSTLKAVHDQGMPHKGLDEVRNHMGAEMSGKSDLQVVDAIGHDVVKAVGEQGFPSKEVDQHRSEHGGSRMDALGSLANEARQAQQSQSMSESSSKSSGTSASAAMEM